MNGEIDCAVITPWKSTRCAAQYLLTDEIVVLVPEGHRLRECSEIELARLARELILVPQPTMNLGKIIGYYFHQAGIEPRLRYQLECPELLVGLVKEHQGVLPMPSMLVPERLEGLRLLRFKERPTRDLALIVSRDRPLPTAARVLMSHIRASLRPTHPSVASSGDVAGIRARKGPSRPGNQSTSLS